MEKVFKGISVCGGIARGVIQLHHLEEESIPHRTISEQEIPTEIARLEEALIATRQQLLTVLKEISSAIGSEDASIFEAHLLVLEDRTLIEEVIKHLHADKENVEFVFDKVAHKYAQELAKIDDPYLRERAIDITDVTRRVLRNLMGARQDDLAHIGADQILVCRILSPSEAVMLHPKPNLGVAMELGSPSSHTAILLRSKGIPAVMGLHEVAPHLQSGQTALLDGYNGLLILDPTRETLGSYAELEERRHRVEVELESLRALPTETLDGRRLILSANVESPDEVPILLAHGAEGVGLFRTEYLFLNRNDAPSEEEQYNAYAQLARELRPNPVVVRTVDLGRDKLPLTTDYLDEMNPSLGFCSIRYCLEHPEMFKTQLRAIVRASAEGNVKMMFPMISGVAEVKKALAMLDEVRAELQQKSIPFNADMEVGAMIEIPSAALTADLIAREVDFFSIGTNDLVQYSLAVDRGNERIAYLYEPTHPAIIVLLKRIVEAGHAHGIWVGLCGEMATDPVLTPLLVGLGLDELSANAISVPAVKRVIRSVKMCEAQKLVEQALQCSSASEIFELTHAATRRAAPDLF
jgi:phosphotransferase system enzyme I (PtsI)